MKFIWKRSLLNFLTTKPVGNVNHNLFIFYEASLKLNIDWILKVVHVLYLNMKFSSMQGSILFMSWRILNLSNISAFPGNEYVLPSSAQAWAKLNRANLLFTVPFTLSFFFFFLFKFIYIFQSCKLVGKIDKKPAVDL